MQRLWMCGVVSLMLAANVRAAENFDVARLAWLEGLWTGTQNGVAMEERWSSPAGGTLLGFHRDIRNGRAVAFEFFRIATTSEGTFYFASPQARPPTAFRLVTLESHRVVFENKQHDFPQRVLYWLDAAGALHARIEGTLEGKQQSEEWVWTKARELTPAAPQPLQACRQADGSIVMSHDCTAIAPTR